MELAISPPITIPSRYLKLPGIKEKHPLYPELQMLALLISNQAHLQHQFRQIHKQLYQQNDGQTFKRWTNFYSKTSINSYSEPNTVQPNAVNIIEFLTEEFKRNFSYKSLVSVRSALGNCLPYYFINHNTVSRFLKDVYNLTLCASKYFAMWHVNILLSHMQRKGIFAFYAITKKLATLFLTLASTRVNTLAHLKVTNVYITDTEVTLIFDEVLQHFRTSYEQKPLIFRAFTSRDLCPVTTLFTLIEYRLHVSDDPALFITTVKLHNV